MTEKNLLSTRRFNVNRVERRLEDGQCVQREVIRHPGSVVILPVLQANRICLIRNYRVAVGKTLVELPAGTLEPNEPPELCAARELIEETGYRAARIDFVSSFYAAPGILDELMHFYVAHDLTEGAANREAGEEIENLVVSWQQALTMIHDGTICDAKTIVGLLIYNSKFDNQLN